MREFMMLIVLCALAMGCAKKHPIEVKVDPAMKSGDYEKIAVLPFASSLHRSDDPDGVAPATMDQILLNELDKRDDYRFVSPTSVMYAIDGADMKSDMNRFIDDWTKNQRVDTDFLQKLSKVMNVEAVLIGVVDLWQLDEVDYREEGATPTTYVGATVSIIGVEEGKILFQAKDEDFEEGARSEDRQVHTSALGTVRSDPGAKVYEAPDPKIVADRVCKALVSAIPNR